MTRMPKAWPRRATSRPMRPKPITPRTLSANWAPMNSLRSHFPQHRDWYAGAIERESASIRAKACSAVLRVFPAGVFITTIPWRVAAFLSMLSVPTPARTIALSLRLPSSDSAVIFTPLRTIAPSKRARDSLSSWPLSPWISLYSKFESPRSNSRPSGAIGSNTKIRVFIAVSILWTWSSSVFGGE